MKGLKQYKRIRKNTLALLNAGEGQTVEYKENVKGLQAEDLVAFANAKSGGSILVGIREDKSANGRQIGKPIGIQISDSEKLIIINRALSCVPPVQVSVFVENTEEKPFFRVDVKSGMQKPYSTSGGVYKIREDGRKQPLHQDSLLGMFLEREAKNFKQRFSDATSGIEDKLANTLTYITELESSISDKIDEISWEIGLSEDRAGDAVSTIEVVEGIVASLVNQTRNQNQRLRSIISATDASDPIKDKAEEKFVQSILKALEVKQKEVPDLLEILKKTPPDGLQWSGNKSDELDNDDVKRLADIAVRKFIDVNESENE